MTKADLRTGMVVTCRNCYKYLLVCNAKTVIDSCEIGGIGYSVGAYWQNFDEFNYDLTHPYNSQFDVVKIEIVNSIKSIETLLNGTKTNLTLIWTRNKKKKYTYDQLKEILGEEFEIVKE